MGATARAAGSALADALASARRTAGLSLTAVADSAGTSASHLSRLERGERTGVSPALVERLAKALQVDPTDLLSSAGYLAAEVSAALSEPDLARALGPGSLPTETRDLLRRRHIAAVAEKWRREAGEPAVQVDPVTVLKAHNLTVYFDRESRTQVRFPDGAHAIVNPSGGPIPARFLVAHAAGHAALQAEPACDLESQSDSELDATAFAGFLLGPHAGVLQACREASPRYDVWEPQAATGFITEVAGHLGMPVWLAARRLAEDGRLAEAAERGER